ncbi:MAG: glycosyl hydrolase 53 family protein [Lachnospiraceae bacterium]
MKTDTLIKGMDISTLFELEELGAAYYDGGKKEDLFTILKRYGVNAVRLRLWNDPYSETGIPYGAGKNDLATTLVLAKRAKQAQMGILLDFQYSDFWADPGKQTIPKAWRGFSDEELTAAVFVFTRDTLLVLKKEGVFPDMVQVGNELTNGLLWPNGKKPNYDRIAEFVNAGIRAVRTVSMETPVMLHLDNGGNLAMYQDWFDRYMGRRGELDFEIIGLSYYPFWHGTMQMLSDNMRMLAARYRKDLIVCETSMGYTLDDYAQYEKLPAKDRKGMATKPALVENLEFPMTIEGQSQFMKSLIELIASVPDNRGRGYYYWEPAWIPVPGCGWANEAALTYINESGPGGNEWANQALFDYEGNALPALRVIRDYPHTV